MFGKKQETESDFDRLVGWELGLVKRRQQIEEERLRLEADLSNEYLNNPGPIDPEPFLRLDSELRVIQTATRSCLAKRAEVVKREYAAEALTLRSQAGLKRKELATLTAKFEKLVGQISDLQGIVFDPQEVLSIPPNAPWLNTPRPLSIALGVAAAELESKADILENAELAPSGNLALEDVLENDAILKAVLTHRSHVPSGEAIVAWIQNVERTALNKNRVLAIHPREVRLSWKAGEIDVASSYIFVRALGTPPVSIYHVEANAIDPASATFKAGPDYVGEQGFGKAAA